MAAPKITLYIDVVSPFAYIAFHVLRNSPTFAKCSVTYVPIFLGGLMKTCGNTAPLFIKNKDKWINVERLRWARYFSVPMRQQMPEGFPVPTLGVQRALCALVQQEPGQLAHCVDALYRALWVDGNSKIGQPEGFMPVLQTALGSERAQQLLAASSQPDAKALLSSNTERAFQAGAFGLPWFECTSADGKTEGFWGIDHLGQVVDFLGLDRSLDSGLRAVL